MKSLTQRLAMSAVMFAVAATAFGASAQSAAALNESRSYENFESQLSAGSSVPTYTPAEHGITARPAKRDSKQTEYFEQQESILSAPSYNPAEHPNAKPAPRSAHPVVSVFANPLNTASPGA
jgi:hypothetical protein